MMGDNTKRTTVAQRIEQLIKSSGLKTGDFANRVGIQKSAVSHLTSGRNKPSFEVISNMLIAFPELNPDWLILGSEPMLRDAIHTNVVNKTSQKTTDEATLPPSSQKDLLNDLESTDIPPMFSEKRKDSIKDTVAKSNTSTNNEIPPFGNSSVAEAHNQERCFDTTLPSSTPRGEREKSKEVTIVNKIPDVIVLQPDGRYFRYRAIEEQ